MPGVIIVKRLAINLLVTFLISEVFYLLAFLVFYVILDREAREGMDMLLYLVECWNLALALCSLTVFLNVSDKVRHNKLYSSLTFFLLPLIAITAYSVVMVGSMYPSLLISLPFFVVHTIFYVKFFRSVPLK
jgi:hypothetical protein